jgi:hypothetical protein
VEGVVKIKAYIKEIHPESAWYDDDSIIGKEVEIIKLEASRRQPSGYSTMNFRFTDGVGGVSPLFINGVKLRFVNEKPKWRV